MKSVLGLALLHLLTLVCAGEQLPASTKGTTPPANPRIETKTTSVFLNRLFKESVGTGQDVRLRNHEDLGSTPDTHTPLSVTVPGLQSSESTPRYSPANTQRGSTLWSRLTQPSRSAPLLQGNAGNVEGSQLDEQPQRDADFRMRSIILWLASQLRAQQKLQHKDEPHQKDRHQTAPRSGVEVDLDDNIPRPIAPQIRTRVVSGGVSRGIREDMMRNMTARDLALLLYHLWGVHQTVVTTVVQIADTCCMVG